MRTRQTKTKYIALILAVILTASVFSLCFPSVAYGTSWGNTETSSLWQYADGALGVPEAKNIVDGWDKTSFEKPIVIAVIDTGINVYHELFENTLLKDENGEVQGYNVFKGDQTSVSDLSDAPSGHGTSVSGVIAMLIEEFGLQDHIKIYTIKANTDTTDEFKLKNLVTAINHASEIGADVINLSLGLDSSSYKKTLQADRTAFEFALESARENSVVVAAAGNGGADCATETGKFYPAVWDTTIGVMGFGKDGKIYSTSNYGAEYDICAPGESIYTATGHIDTDTYALKNGTSMAAAAVSFASALLKLRFVAESKTAPTSSQIVRMIRNLNGLTSDKGSATFRALSLEKLLTQDFENTSYDYMTPTAMSLTHNGNRGSGDFSNSVWMRANEIVPVSFVCKISPLGKIDPDIENSVEWKIQRMTEADGEVVEEQPLSVKGTKFDFIPSRGGDFLLIASLPLFGLTASQKIHVEYLPYYVGEVRVTYADSVRLGVDGAPFEGVLYTTESTDFGLTGLEYVNPDVEIKWFVNGEYVASGKTFSFKPKKAGRYEITAQYGDNEKVDFQYKFTANVKSFILRPLDLSMLIAGIAVVLTATAVIATAVVKKKRSQQNSKIEDRH